MKKGYEFYLPVKIVGGEGQSRCMDRWVKQFDAKRLLIITGSHVSKTESFEAFTSEMKKQNIDFEVFAESVPEPPVESVDKLSAHVKENAFDLVIAVGGGSAMDTAKAVCMLNNNEGSMADYLFGGTRTPVYPSLPLICIPTTAGSGSEVTASCVMEDTQKHVKLSCTHPNLIPKVAILDPLMQLEMPPSVTAGTGMDAMTHAVEAYTSKKSGPFSDMYAQSAIQRIAEYLPKVMEAPDRLDYRMKMAEASTMAAVAFLNGGLTAVHGISQAIGGIAHTSHGITNALVLPGVMALNYSGNIEKFANVARWLGCDTTKMTDEEAAARTPELLEKLNKTLRLPEKLSDLGVTEKIIPDIVNGTMGYRMLSLNPVEIREEQVEELLKKLI